MSPTDCGASLCVIKKPRKRGGPSPRWTAEPEKNKLFCRLSAIPFKKGSLHVVVVPHNHLHYLLFEHSTTVFVKYTYSTCPHVSSVALNCLTFVMYGKHLRRPYTAIHVMQIIFGVFCSRSACKWQLISSTEVGLTLWSITVYVCYGWGMLFVHLTPRRCVPIFAHQNLYIVTRGSQQDICYVSRSFKASIQLFKS
jgi:hypothetical protein